MQTSATGAGLRASRAVRARRLMIAALAAASMCSTDTRREPVTDPAAQTMPASSAATQPSIYDQALALYRAGRAAEAAVLLETALAGPLPDAAGYHALLGWCRYRLGQNEAALQSFSTSLRLAPDNADGMEGS